MEEMARISINQNAFVLAITKVSDQEVHKFGVLEGQFRRDDTLFEIKGLVEKPNRENAPSNFAVVGRYILGPQIFQALDAVEKKKNSELSLTEALDKIAKGDFGDIPVLGYLCESSRFDTGDKLGYSKAFVEFAMKHDIIGKDFKEWLGMQEF